MARDALASARAGLGEEHGWALPGRESRRRFVLLGFEIVFLLVVIGSLEMIFTRGNQRFDLTPTKRYSLSPVTIRVLQDLAQPVQVTVFYRQGEREKHAALLRLMAQESSFVRTVMCSISYIVPPRI